MKLFIFLCLLYFHFLQSSLQFLLQEYRIQNISQKKARKFENQEKKISKLCQKKQKQEQKLKNEGLDGKTQGAKSAVITSSMVNQYLESGKEDNAGVDAAYKVTDQVENISRKIYHHGKKKNLKRQKKITKLGKSIENQEKKLFFKKNMEEMKKVQKLNQ